MACFNGAHSVWVEFAGKFPGIFREFSNRPFDKSDERLELFVGQGLVCTGRLYVVPPRVMGAVGNNLLDGDLSRAGGQLFRSPLKPG